MNRVLGFLFVASLLCLGEGRRVSISANNDPLELVKEIIYEANQEVDKQGIAVLKVDVGTEGKHYWVKNGQLGKLDTLELRGDDQFFNQTDQDDESVFTFDLHVGLKDLQFQGEVGYRYLFFFRSSGLLSVSVSDEALRVQGRIHSMNNGSCTATIDSAVVEKLGNIEINYEGHWFLTHIAHFVANHVLPWFRGTINRHVAEIVRVEVPKSNFEELACKPFVI